MPEPLRAEICSVVRLEPRRIRWTEGEIGWACLMVGAWCEEGEEDEEEEGEDEVEEVEVETSGTAASFDGGDVSGEPDSKASAESEERSSPSSARIAMSSPTWMPFSPSLRCCRRELGVSVLRASERRGRARRQQRRTTNEDLAEDAVLGRFDVNGRLVSLLLVKSAPALSAITVSQ